MRKTVDETEEYAKKSQKEDGRGVLAPHNSKGSRRATVPPCSHQVCSPKETQSSNGSNRSRDKTVVEVNGHRAPGREHPAEIKAHSASDAI